MTYDVSSDQTIKQIVPGLAFFTDLHHLHCGNLTISVVWIATRLIRTGFHLRCQPLLTLGHYLASTVCQDLSTTIEIKLLRIESLCALGRFEAALHHFHHVVSGKCLPNPADIIRAKVLSRQLPFDDSKPLTDKKNFQTLNNLCLVNVNQSSYANIYGKELCHKISVAQSKILISIAELVNEVPSEDVKDSSSADLMSGLLTAEKSISVAQLRISKSNVQFKKSRDKSDEVSFIDMKQSSLLNQIKWKLLNRADPIVREMLKVIFIPKTSGDGNI